VIATLKKDGLELTADLSTFFCDEDIAGDLADYAPGDEVKLPTDPDGYVVSDDDIPF
jgi:hypothetical protein